MFALRILFGLLVVVDVHGWNRAETVTSYDYKTTRLPVSLVTKTKTVYEKFTTDNFRTDAFTITVTCGGFTTNRHIRTTTVTSRFQIPVTSTKVKVEISTDLTQTQVTTTWTVTSTEFYTATKTMDLPLLFIHTKVLTTDEMLPVYRTKKIFEFEKVVVTIKTRTTVTSDLPFEDAYN